MSNKYGDGTLEIRDIGSFHIGGSSIELRGLPLMQFAPVPGSPAVSLDPNGTFHSGQMYAQYVRLAKPAGRYPLLFWHGGGMTGVCWETKPDGAPGWQNFFLRAGYDVYLCDAVERGRAGWSRYPEIFPDQPFFMPYEGGWHLYRIGPVAGYLARQGYDGGQFPVEVFDDFMCQIVPRWSCNNVMISGAYDELLRRVGPSVIVAHSQGGDFAIRAALRNPDLVRALVLIEPGGAPAEEDYAALADMPILVLWGDFIEDVPFWNGIRPLIDSACEAIAAAGGNVTVIDLPSIGMGGNSHIIMMDRNSDQIAGMVEKWLNEL